jgi:hypothetical protein
MQDPDPPAGLRLESCRVRAKALISGVRFLDGVPKGPLRITKDAILGLTEPAAC